MRRRGGFVTELGLALVIATVVGVAFLLATGELGAAWDALRDDEAAAASAPDRDEDEGEASPSPEETPTTSGALRPGIEYVDVNHVSGELNEKGVVCEDTNVHVRDDESQTGTCVSASGAEVTIFVYLRAAAAPASFDEYIEATDGSVLEGPNWFLASTDTDFLTDAQAILGGETREL